MVDSPRHQISRTRCTPIRNRIPPRRLPFKADGKDHSWLVSEKANTYFDKMSEDAENCYIDKWGVYIYNDFAGYGEIELLENTMNAFEKEWKTVRGRLSLKRIIYSPPLKNIGFVVANYGYSNKQKPRKVVNLCEDAGRRNSRTTVASISTNSLWWMKITTKTTNIATKTAK